MNSTFGTEANRVCLNAYNTAMCTNPQIKQRLVKDKTVYYYCSTCYCAPRTFERKNLVDAGWIITDDTDAGWIRKDE
jgi:hypothetical protein